MRICCDVCGQRIPARQWLASLFDRRELTYPRRMINGDRAETPVKRLCARCEHRAFKLRRQSTGDALPNAGVVGEGGVEHAVSSSTL